ncbi:MAG: hypothetical protein AAF708_14200 [Deinococcota bacterium]
MRLGMALLVMVALQVTGLAQEEADVSGPCETPQHAQFDFWVGNWRVEDPEGTFQGTNNIVKLLDSCVIQENWEGASGLRGHSYNLYYAAADSWHQTWVDTSGSLLQLDGGLVDDVMVLEGTTPSVQEPGVTVYHRISWNVVDGNADHVRQHWEVSTDDQASWRTVFDGQYYRVEE